MSINFLSSSSREIDQSLGLEVHAIESRLLEAAKRLRPAGNMACFGEVLHGGHQTWVGLDPEVLNTPYAELVEICRILTPGKGARVVDLGAGYGRLGFVLLELYPEVEFIGLELVAERVEEGNRVLGTRGAKGARLFVQDLTSTNFVLPEANFYFLYDFGKVSHIRQILESLSRAADHHRFQIVARGRGSRSQIDFEHPWLTETHRAENFSIYSS